MTKIVARVTFDFAYEAHDPSVTPDRVKRVLTGYFEDVIRQGWANLDGFNESAVELVTPVALGVFTRYEDHTKNSPYMAGARPQLVYRGTAPAQSANSGKTSPKARKPPSPPEVVVSKKRAQGSKESTK
jgi:hypothetical protein